MESVLVNKEICACTEGNVFIVSDYWHTQSYNAPARSLYDEVARPTSFVVYER